MRIALISTLTRPVPPGGEGSVELLVWLLAEALVDRGHNVTLYALPGSRTRAYLRSPVETSYTADSEKWDWQLYEAYQVREAFQAWRDFDVIHNHSYHFGLLFADFVPVPSIHSVHVEPGPDLRFLAARTSNQHLAFASQYQARDFRDLQNVHVVPHGIDMSGFEVARPNEQENYLAYLGRFHPDKGPLDAIQIAKATGYRLKLAGPTNDYFRAEVLPHIDNRQVEYVGEVRDAQKAEFLAHAHALLYPVSRGEPFGLVLVEAMAAGLPVIAYNRGAAAEVVEHGISGWIGETRDELEDGVAKVSELDRSRIRASAEARFSVNRMVDEFENLYRRIVKAPDLELVKEQL